MKNVEFGIKNDGPATLLFKHPENPLLSILHSEIVILNSGGFS